MTAMPSAYDHGGEAGPHNNIKSVVAAHGHAMSSTYHQGGGAHHVTSVHPDGHHHISTGHPTFEHATEHMGIAHGVGE